MDPLSKKCKPEENGATATSPAGSVARLPRWTSPATTSSTTTQRPSPVTCILPPPSTTAGCGGCALVYGMAAVDLRKRRQVEVLTCCCCCAFAAGSLLCRFQTAVCNEYSVPKDKLDHFKNITAHGIVCLQVEEQILLTRSWTL
ncbi:unnamed protein product [Urochloa humidicola]